MTTELEKYAPYDIANAFALFGILAFLVTIVGIQLNGDAVTPRFNIVFGALSFLVAILVYGLSGVIGLVLPVLEQFDEFIQALLHRDEAAQNRVYDQLPAEVLVSYTEGNVSAELTTGDRDITGTLEPALVGDHVSLSLEIADDDGELAGAGALLTAEDAQALHDCLGDALDELADEPDDLARFTAQRRGNAAAPTGGEA